MIYLHIMGPTKSIFIKSSIKNIYILTSLIHYITNTYYILNTSMLKPIHFISIIIAISGIFSMLYLETYGTDMWHMIHV